MSVRAKHGENVKQRLRERGTSGSGEPVSFLRMLQAPEEAWDIEFVSGTQRSR